MKIFSALFFGDVFKYLVVNRITPESVEVIVIIAGAQADLGVGLVVRYAC